MTSLLFSIMMIRKIVQKISIILFNISPRLWAIVSDAYSWASRFNPVDAYLRRRYIKNAESFWTNEDGIGPLEDSTERTRLLRQQISSLGVTSVLEVGCSYGAVLKALMQDENCKITHLAGCDFGTTRLEKARGFIGNDRVELVYCDVTKELPYRDNSYDLLFSISTLQHVSPEDLDKALSEMVRVARRYIVHEEYMVPSSLSFAHDYPSWYQKRGHRITFRARNWEPSKRHRELLVIELNKLNLT